MDDPAAKRLREARLKAGYETGTAAARAFGWTVSTYLSHENGTRPIGRSAKEYAKRFNVPLGWLLIGEQTGSSGQKPRAATDQLALDLRVPIPEIDAHVGAGGGGLMEIVNATPNGQLTLSDEDIRGHWQLPPGYLRGELRIDPRRAFVVEVDGDSMEPTLRSGDRVLIDSSDQRPRDGIFAIWNGFAVVIKRLELIGSVEPVRVRMISDNPRHSPEERTLEEVHIIGRARLRTTRL
jgi:phage repressor protein C with HTH and peptisase S24 domain